MNDETFSGKRILVTGATGSWGQTLIDLLLKEHNPKQIICFSRGEPAQVFMRRKFKNNPILKFVLGDVRDMDALEDAMYLVDYVFHLAALKHVPVCEENVEETTKTNVLGTMNVIRAAKKANVYKVIDVSSDKAVDPINIYGMTKAIGEKSTINASHDSDTIFMCVRGGNVIGSSGSVVPLFIDQIKSGNNITITDLEMTRFFITQEEAIRLLFTASLYGIGGETFVLNMNSCRILDLAEVLIDELADHPVKIDHIGIRPGEKLHEILVSKSEVPFTRIFNDNYFVILPPNMPHLQDMYKNLLDFEQDSFTSDTSIMNKHEIRQMLINSKFL